MPWNPNQIDSEILAVHAALVPNGPQGEVVLFGGDEHWGNQQESAGNNSWKKTRVYDVASHTLVSGQIQSPDSDVFCAHHAFIGDGRLLIAGGTSEWPVDDDGHDHNLAFLGHSRCWLYNHQQRRWVETTRLNRNPAQPDEARSGGRWYPGLVTLADGSVLALFGHLDRNDWRHRNTLPERYFPHAQQWLNLPGDIGKPGEPDSGGRRFLFFPRCYQLPSGKLFFATPMPAEFSTQAGNQDGPHYSTAFDVASGQYQTPRAASPDGVDGSWSFPAVLLPLLPSNNGYNARCFYWSGNVPRWIDTDATNPTWTNAGNRDAAMSGRNRIYGNAVLLPTAQVCLVGGVHQVDPQDPVLQVELYTPEINWTTNTYGNGGGSWQVDSSAAINARNYHSTALLLPNGKVWVAGGNVNANSGDPNVVGMKKIELYEPPYIAVANRIQIQNAPRLLGYQDEFAIQLDRNASNVGRVALIRNSSVTHASDNDQRYVGLEIVSRSGNTVQVRSPLSGNVAPPGYYTLWVVDNSGNPCQLARFVRLAHLSCRVVTDRSTFSQEEVQALGGGSNALFTNALYVDFDGFTDTELSGIPTASVQWQDGSGPVASNQLRVQFNRRYTEANPPQPEVPTRITYVYDLIFENMDAYNGWLDRRDIVIRFELNHHSCNALLELSKHPNPYMIDISPVTQNPSWLSTDLRVFKVRPNQTRLGVTLNMSGNGPWTFIRGALDRLRSGNESFDALPTDGSEATLDGAYLSGSPMLPSFNFAIARVRYRATTTSAQNVRCFFRLCNYAGTGLEFNSASVYRTHPGANPVPLLGVAGGQLVSIPFFNAQRIETVAGRPGAASMTSQSLDPQYDIQTIAPNPGGAEVTAYFGCYLDINLPTKRFPINPANEGPFSEASALPIRDLLRSWHNCLVAELFFDQDPTRPGASPSDSDNLAQRNLAIIGLENPGLKISRTAMHTFEIAPSLAATSPGVGQQNQVAALKGSRRHRADELFFDWHNLPGDTQVTLYFSDLDTNQIIELVRETRMSEASFTVLDQQTLRFRVGDCAWMPIPGGREQRIPALISIALPEGIIEGQVYRASVRQISGITNRIIGSLTLEMPVSKAAFLLPEARRQLSFISHISGLLAPEDRWSPLFTRLVAYLAARVDALGGNSQNIFPNPDGSGKPYQPIDWQAGDPFPADGFGSAQTGESSNPNRSCANMPYWCAVSLLAILLTGLAVFDLPLALACLAALTGAVIGVLRTPKLCCKAERCCLAQALVYAAATALIMVIIAGLVFHLSLNSGGVALIAVALVTGLLIAKRCTSKP